MKNLQSKVLYHKNVRVFHSNYWFSTQQTITTLSPETIRPILMDIEFSIEDIITPIKEEIFIQILQRLMT